MCVYFSAGRLFLGFQSLMKIPLQIPPRHLRKKRSIIGSRRQMRNERGIPVAGPAASGEETQQSVGEETDATKEVDAIFFFNSLTSAFKIDVMAAVKADMTDAVKKTELVMKEMMDLKKKVENQMKDVMADIKGQINQLEKTLSDQIGALKPLPLPVILEEKGKTSKQPQDDGGAAFEKSLKPALQDKYEADSERSVASIKGDYQCYHPMGLLSNLIGRGLDAASLGPALRASFTDSHTVQSCYVEEPGVSFVLSEKWMAENIQNMLYQGIKLWAPKLQIQKAIVDFSSPQTADDMRLSHFRGAVMGESIARMFQFSGVKVLRSTHVTTCGTQGWKHIRPPEWEPLPEDTCTDLQTIFNLVGVQWREEEGSFYSHKEKTLQDLNVFIPVNATIPFLPDVLTELTSIWFRLQMQKIEWLIYITPPEHKNYFNITFKFAKVACWLSSDNGYPKASHISADKLSHGRRALLCSDLIGEIKMHCEDLYVGPNQSREQRQQNVDALAYASLKYAILKNTSDDIDIDQMFDLKGNTAVYLLRTYSWICDLIKKSGGDLEDLKRSHEISFDNGAGRPLGAHLIRFREIVEESCTFLNPGILCKYLHDLALIFTKFYAVSEALMTEKNKKTRCLLCEATRIVMLKCFDLLGIPPLGCYF